MKSPNNITFSYVFKYMERVLDNISKCTDLFCPEDLYTSTISHFLNRRFVFRKRVSLSSLCAFSCFQAMISLTYMDRIPPELSLPCLDILYLAKPSLLSGNELSILVSNTKNISNALYMKGFSNSNLFLRKFIFRWSFAEKK